MDENTAQCSSSWERQAAEAATGFEIGNQVGRPPAHTTQGIAAKRDWLEERINHDPIPRAAADSFGKRWVTWQDLALECREYSSDFGIFRITIKRALPGICANPLRSPTCRQLYLPVGPRYRSSQSKVSLINGLVAPACPVSKRTLRLSLSGDPRNRSIGSWPVSMGNTKS